MWKKSNLLILTLGRGLYRLLPLFLGFGYLSLLIVSFLLPTIIGRGTESLSSEARILAQEAEGAEKRLRLIRYRAEELSRSCIAEKAVISHYGAGFEGKRMANGQVFHSNCRFVAHKSLRFGTRVFFIYKNRLTFGTITDRGPYIEPRAYDISTGMAGELGLIKPGIAEVEVVIIGEIK